MPYTPQPYNARGPSISQDELDAAEAQRQADLNARYAAQQQQQAASPLASAVGSRIAGQIAQHEADNRAEEEAYRQQVGGLTSMVAASPAQFAAARAPQEQAVGVLGQRASTLEGSQAALAGRQAGEAAQARTMVAARTPYGKAAAPEAAILGGQIGAAQAATVGQLEQEAAQRQAAYMRGLGALGAGAMNEVEQRRLAEQELLRDMQIRFLAAQKIAASKAQQSAAEDQAAMGRFGSVVGAGLGFLAGGPAGAAAGATLGGKVAG
jgi:hypothetical protein